MKMSEPEGQNVFSADTKGNEVYILESEIGQKFFFFNYLQ